MFTHNEPLQQSHKEHEERLPRERFSDAAAFSGSEGHELRAVRLSARYVGVRLSAGKVGVRNETVSLRTTDWSRVV